MKRVLVGLSIACACGDNSPKIEVFEPTNGSRLAIEQYQFEDGTRLVQPTAFYDRRIHARCTPQEWLDGVIRCVPDAEEAYYRDDTCTTLFGVGNAIGIDFATHFLATNSRADGARFPARAFAAGEPILEPTAVGYVKSGDSCTAISIFQSDVTTYWELGDEVGELVSITEREIGEGRLGLVVRESDDGALVPLGFRDRDHDVPCAPSPDDTCALLDVPSSDVFADTTCTMPAILVGPGAPIPTIASTQGRDGCPIYHAVQSTPSERVYADGGDGCTSVLTSLQALPLSAPIELAPLTRTVDDAPRRRVQRISVPLPIAEIAGAGERDVQVYTSRLFDTAIRAECELRKTGDTVHCLPTALAPIVRVFQPGCVVERRLALVPDVACEPAAFAMYDTGETLELHAIGDRFEGTAFTIDPFGTCSPYAPSYGVSFHTVGPVLPAETFAGAIPFGAR